MRADGSHTPHCTAAARVRPAEHHPWSVGDGPGASVYQILYLSALHILASGIPRRYRQIRGTGCNPNMHLFMHGEASKCFKSAFNTMAAKLTSFRGGWVRFPAETLAPWSPALLARWGSSFWQTPKWLIFPKIPHLSPTLSVLLASSHWALPQALSSTVTDHLSNKPQPCKSHMGCP